MVRIRSYQAYLKIVDLLNMSCMWVNSINNENNCNNNHFPITFYAE